MTKPFVSKRASVLNLSLLLLFSLSCNDAQLDSNDSLEWMKTVTDIEIPEDAKNEKFYNNHEWGMIAEYSFSEGSFLKFCKKHKLNKIENKEFKMLLLQDIERSEIAVSNSHYLGYSDCEKGNSWKLIADKRNRIVWLEVLYPDNSGDIEPCEKNKVANKE